MKKLLLILTLSLTLMAATIARAASPNGDEAKEMIIDIINVIGLKANFELRAINNIPNAAAITVRGKRFIAYNPEFIAKLNTAAGNKWASVSVLAHEIGHHLNGHTLAGTGSQPKLELEADEFSGFVLQKMGASLSQAQAAMKIAANYRQSHTHPAQQDRLVAIEKGWNQAGGKQADLAKYNAAPSREQAYPEQKTQEQQSDRNAATLDSRMVLAKVDFPADRSGNYYITTGYNLVKESNGQLYLLGKMLRTNNSEYPFVMKGNDAKTTLFVERTGRIVTSQKQVAGYLRKSV